MSNKCAKHKVENAILFIAAQIQPLSVSKVTTLLYLADEHSIRRSGAPVLWLSYSAQIGGPALEHPLPWHLLIPPIQTFIDDEFADYDIDVLQYIVTHYGRYTDEELITMLKKENNLWNRTRKDPATLIDFTKLLDTDYKKAVFAMAYESQRIFE